MTIWWILLDLWLENIGKWMAPCLMKSHKWPGVERLPLNSQMTHIQLSLAFVGFLISVLDFSKRIWETFWKLIRAISDYLYVLLHIEHIFLFSNTELIHTRPKWDWEIHPQSVGLQNQGSKIPCIPLGCVRIQHLQQPLRFVGGKHFCINKPSLGANSID